MFTGETIQSGASNKCPSCGITMYDKVLKSAAGYYIGTACCCGPYSRESGYYRDSDAAHRALKNKNYFRQ